MATVKTFIGNVRGDDIVISATEPTGNDRKKVWIQKGKNLFNKNSVKFVNGYFYLDTTNITSSSVSKTLYIPITGGTTYTITKISSARFNVGTTEDIPVVGVKLVDNAKNVAENGIATITLATSSTAKYLVVWYYASNADTLTEKEILNSIQVELGNTATGYEQYVEPKIYVKNDNNVYEEFINVNQLEELTLQAYNLGLGETINSDADLNNFTTAGVYVSPNASVSASLKNNPIPDAGFKLVVEYTVQEKTRVKQTMHVNNTYCSTLVRYYNGTWGKWYSLGLTEYNAPT